jgi:Rrf2 family transcriptional regulator, cysteine metabolism repressor
MKLSTKVRYAVTAMFDIVSNGNSRPVRVKDVAYRQGISQDYLEQIFNRLRKSGIIKSVRGPGGGFVLNKKANRISVGDIIRAIEGPIGLATCVYGICDKSACCSTKSLWDELSRKVSKTFDATSLSSLCRKMGAVK